jgi:hypothetical protein
MIDGADEMAELQPGAHLRAIVIGPRTQIGGVRRRAIWHLRQLHQMVERLPVGKPARRRHQSLRLQDLRHPLQHPLHVGVRAADHGRIDAKP